MNALIYNIALVVGLVLIGVGVGMQCGVAAALTVVGVVVLICTMYTAHIALRG
jgi:hypothetical protein